MGDDIRADHIKFIGTAGGVTAMFTTLAFFLIAVLLMLGVVADSLWGRLPAALRQLTTLAATRRQSKGTNERLPQRRSPGQYSAQRSIMARYVVLSPCRRNVTIMVTRSTITTVIRDMCD
jgi:hypothetical protein